MTEALLAGMIAGYLVLLVGLSVAAVVTLNPLTCFVVGLGWAFAAERAAATMEAGRFS